MDKIKAIENEQLRENKLDLNIGDTVKVHCKIKEGNRERIQIFEGTIIKKQRGHGDVETLGEYRSESSKDRRKEFRKECKARRTGKK